MIKYAKIVDNETKACEVATGDNEDFYKSIGMELLDVEESWCGWYLKGYAPKTPKEQLIKEYDKALEAHLKAEREARGWTTREPTAGKGTGIARWEQDAEDWTAHYTEVMLYGLQVENDYADGYPVPTLEEFKEKLPKIVWTFEG